MAHITGRLTRRNRDSVSLAEVREPVLEGSRRLWIDDRHERCRVMARTERILDHESLDSATIAIISATLDLESSRFLKEESPGNAGLFGIFKDPTRFTKPSGDRELGRDP
jgi:hypothetical protein